MRTFQRNCLIFCLISVSTTTVCGATEFVTCGSVLKLVNTHYDVRLHSHDVTYATGSEQQSVTGVKDKVDTNSHWVVRGPGRPCVRGDPVTCGSAVRLTHLGTGRNLRSHDFASPMSRHREVSAHKGEDKQELWTVECGDKRWERDEEVTLRHVATDVYLSVSGRQYGHPIAGQYEVVGVASRSLGPTLWRAAEGVFVHPSEPHQTRVHTEHSEL